MAAITMTPGSQPASMPAESNRFQQTPLTSTARSNSAEIDPSWEIRALSADWISTSSQHDASCDAALCANPHTPVCGSPLELSPVPTVEQCADAVASSRGHKFEEIRAKCVELDGNMNVPECAITATGKVSHAQRLTQLFCTLTLIPLLLN